MSKRSASDKEVAAKKAKQTQEEEQTSSPMANALIGRPAPGFKAAALMPDKTFAEVSLDQYKGKYVCLFFYPLDFTFVCPTEIIAFSDRAKEFKDIGCELLACSIDSKFSHLAWVNQDRKKGGLGQMNIPMIADVTKKISSDYGVLIQDGEDAGIALRGLFIINKAGILRSMTVNDLPVGRSVDETLRTIKAFQFNDEHGEVCPANWTPGAATMVADPVKSQKYFNNVK